MKQLQGASPLLFVDSTSTAEASGVRSDDTFSLVPGNKPPGRENHLSIPCTIRYPKQPVIKGVIRRDFGDRFTVYIPADGSTINVSKLYVYPEFSKSVGQIDISPSKNLSPSNKSQKRRRKGTGSGSIYYRIVNRSGKEYHQAYYHYKLNGKKGTKYIPQRLLGLIKEAEITKLPVVEVLQLLGEKSISPSKKFDTFKNEEDRAVALTEINPSNELSPSKKDLASLETPEELLGEKFINPSNSSITFADEQITTDREVIDSHVINPSNDLSPSNSDEESEATLRLLGDNHIRPSKSFDTSTCKLLDDTAIAVREINPSNSESPSKRQRSRGWITVN